MASLDALRADIRTAIDEAKSRTLRLANLILAAKQAFEDGALPEEIIPERTGNAWLDWCHHHFGFSVRYCHLLAGCAKYLGDNPWFVQHVAQIDLEKLDNVRRIKEPSKAKLFLSRNNIEELTRDELRDRVNEFLGLSRNAAPIAPAQPASLGSAKQLLLDLRDAPIEEGQFAACVDLVESAFELCKAKASALNIGAADRVALAQTMRLMADEISPPEVSA